MGIADKYKDFLSKPIRSLDYWAEGAVLDFTEDLARIMDNKDISRAELAKLVGTSPAYITKVFSGDANFTIETMTKFALAVDHAIRVHIAPMGTRTVWNDIYENNFVQASDTPRSDITVVQATSAAPVAANEFQWQDKVVNSG